MLKKMVEKTDLTESDLTSSSKWGNHRDTQINYKGRKSRAYYNNNYWYLPAFGEMTEGKTSIYNSYDTYGDLLTTGASSATEVYNIYDVAGNMWEWTEEDSIFATSGQYRVLRSGSALHAYATFSACYRLGDLTINLTPLDVGFRTVLYIK